MQAFSFSTSHSMVFEPGAASQHIAAYCLKKGYRSALLVTDPGLADLGLHKETMDSFDDQGLPISVFGKVLADPPESIVMQSVQAARSASADVIIGFGGGSSMDVAKLVSFLAHPECAQTLNDIYGLDQAKGARLPLIQVPTTAGTGSEVTQVAIVTTGETTKMGAVSPLFLADLVVLDVNLTLGLPPSITAMTGVDAMVHAIEAYTSKIKKNAMSDLMAKEALRLMGSHIQEAVHHGNNQDARNAMLLGSMYAGQAFANAPVGAVHALAYPLGGHFHIPHGLSNSLVLPHVLRFNIPHAAALYAELAPIIFPNKSFTGTSESIASQLAEAFEGLIADLQLPNTLADMNIGEERLPELASDAMLQTRLLVNNPRDVQYEDALNIYQAAYR